MATQTPTNLIGPSAAITSTPTAYVSPAATVGIIRNIIATTTATVNLIVALGADAAGTRVINIASIASTFYNSGSLWVITAANSAHAIDVTSTATGTQCLCNISGYQSA